MNSIKNKVIPIFYDKDRDILYFDSIDEFKSNSFKFLLTSRNSWATHEINFNILDKVDDKNTKLIRLVKNLRRRAKLGQIEFGVPIGIQLNNTNGILTRTENNEEWELKRLNNSEISEYLWKPRNTFLLSNNNSYPIASTMAPQLIPVGQGLMFVDENNQVIYDCGGTENIQMHIKRWIKAKLKFHIVISHWHYDHYCYLKELIKNGLVERLYLPKFIYESHNIKELEDLLEEKSIPYIHHSDIKINNYTLIKSPSRAKRVSNMHSCILMNKHWMLTGDQGSNFIKKMVPGSIDVENFQIPHHCSGDKKHHPSKININRIRFAWFSAIPGFYNNMPSIEYITYYAKKKAIIYDVNNKVLSCI